ncbi:hypothetical protein [Streptomyces sp. NPDC026659]|uniref:hypothetical protein n=1 Tax=Streptomyces sp. NPDC026659 TaxID=3155123 RepID=UPI0034042BD0
MADLSGYGVRVASYAELLDIRDDPRSAFLSARLDRLIPTGRVDEGAQHVLMPLLENGYREAVGERTFRCYLWFLESGENARSCVLIDVPESRLSALRRLGQRALEKVVLNLLGELSIETLP